MGAWLQFEEGWCGAVLWVVKVANGQCCGAMSQPRGGRGIDVPIGGGVVVITPSFRRHPSLTT